jgi:hypothetical protein
METEAQSAPPRRPRTPLLVLLAIVLAAAAFVTLRPSTGPTPLTSNPGRAPQQPAGEKPLDPQELKVKLDALKSPPPEPGDTERNPFRFQPKAPPPPPPGPPPGLKKPDPFPQVEVPIGPPPPPPIPLKFIGVTEAPGLGKIAALTDCKHTVQGREGETIEGQYKIVKIGIESLVIERIDGTGRTTLRMSGQDCVAK